MQTTEDTNKAALLQTLLDNGEIKGLMAIMEEMPVVEVAEFLAEQEEENIIKLLRMFSLENQGRILSDFDWDLQYALFQHMDRRDFAEVFQHMYSDSRADFYHYLDKEEQIELLPFLTKKVREDVISLSSYEPDTAGGIMNTDFATIISSMTIKDAIAKIRRDAPSRKMVYYIYVVDELMRMKGFVTLKDLIMAQPDDKVAEIVRENYISVKVEDDRETVANKVGKYNLVAIPVLNAFEQLVGIVSHDDVIDVIRAEHTEEMEKFMGIVPDPEGTDYLDTSIFQHFKKRAVWVVSLAAIGIVSGMIVHQFEDALDQLIILALYMPMIADTGGNSGSQAATVVVRALALGQVSVGDWLSIIFKEARVAFLMSICLGLLAFGKIVFLSYETTLPGQFTLMKVALVISAALSLQVISATIIGAGLPLLVRRFGGDPAVAASPAITTVVDITGLLIYFGMATWLLL